MMHGLKFHLLQAIGLTRLLRRLCGKEARCPKKKVWSQWWLILLEDHDPAPFCMFGTTGYDPARNEETGFIWNLLLPRSKRHWFWEKTYPGVATSRSCTESGVSLSFVQIRFDVFVTTNSC